MISQRIRDFYASHSPTSEPGSLSSMLDGLPVEIEQLIDAIGGVLLHPSTAFEMFGEPEPADRGAGELTMRGMLQVLNAVDPAPLDVPRPVEKRLRVNCRGFAMMFVTVLRHRGIPARKRVGFDWAGDIHEIAEYWNDQRNRWVMVDPDPAMRTPIRRFLAGTGRFGRCDSDTELISEGEAFHSGGLAWRLCRSGQASTERFRDTAYAGMAGVRVALIQDLDSLNKVELRSFDEWHEMMTAPWGDISERSLAWLDQAADLIGDADTRFDDLRTFYANSPYGSAVRTRLIQLVA